MTAITAHILADSISYRGHRLTTWELTYPRFIHSELLTHGLFRRNAASSRAIPTAKLRERVLTGPAIPVHWGQNQKGMQADHEVSDPEIAREWWLRGRDLMAAHHEEGERLGLHKQIVNRVIEPWMMITVILSATDWANYFHQRAHKDAEPNFQKLAHLMREMYFDTLPVEVATGDWHMPFVQDEDWKLTAGMASQLITLLRVSAGRCARVSYLTHDGRRDLQEDVDLCGRLIQVDNPEAPMHASPLDHPAQATGDDVRHGTFLGWKGFRKTFTGEDGPDTTIKCPRCGIWGGQHSSKCRWRAYSLRQQIVNIAVGEGLDIMYGTDNLATLLDALAMKAFRAGWALESPETRAIRRGLQLVERGWIPEDEPAVLR